MNLVFYMHYVTIIYVTWNDIMHLVKLDESQNNLEKINEWAKGDHGVKCYMFS
jgi:hypothetical protein